MIFDDINDIIVNDILFLITLNQAGKYSIKPEHILLVHDELDKPLGKLAMKQGGSAR